MKKFFLFALAISATFTTVSCSTDRDEPTTVQDNFVITPSTVDMKYDKTQQFTVTNNGAASTGFTWKSSDEFRGTVDQNGLLTAKKVGEFNVTATKNGKTVTSKVTVSPYHTFITPPHLDWGSTKAEIKAKETRTIYGETSSVIMYRGGTSDVQYVGYTFDSSGKLINTIVIFGFNTSITSKVMEYYNERYLLISTENSQYGYVNIEKNLAMTIAVDNSLGLHAFYTKL